MLVFTLINSVKEQDIMLAPLPVASPAIVLVCFLIIKQVKVYITKETMGTAVIYFAPSTLRHVTNS